MGKPNVNPVGLRPLYSFDQLVIGPHNHVAGAACHEVISKPGETYNPLFIFGPSGVGKTHLMQATAHEILRQNPSFKARYISAERFVSEMLMAISEDKVLEMRKDYSQLDLLIIDDVQYLSESKMSQDELFHIFNNLHGANSQVILAADRPPNQLTALNKNIRSRLEWGLAVDVGLPDEPTRLEILKKKQDLQGLKLSEETLAYVARLLHSNVRELEGFLKRIHAYVTLSHQEVNFDLVQAVLKEILPEGAVTNLEEPPSVKSVDKTIKPTMADAKPVVKEKVAPVPPPPVVASPPAPPPTPVLPKEPVAPKVPPPVPVAEKPIPPVSSTLPPPVNGNGESFDVLLDSIDLEAPKESFSSTQKSAKAPPPPPELTNGSKNGHHKSPAAKVPKDKKEKPVDDIVLPPPSLPPSAPSNLSFDILLESMDINGPEAPAAKPVANVAPVAPVPPLVPVAPPPAVPVVPMAPAASAPSIPPAAPINQPAAPVPPPPAPVKPAPPVVKPAPAVKISIPVPPPPESSSSAMADDEVGDEGDLPNGYKEVGVVFFYPEGCKEALQTVQRKFQEVIKKHKLKFRMKFVHNEPYSFKGKINYASFVDVCKANKVPVTVVIGPPPDTFIPEQDFYDLLTVTLDVQGVSLQLVNWGEISKDYRYLNLALDIALVRVR